MLLNEILHTAMLSINTARSKHNAGKPEGCKICFRELRELLNENVAELAPDEAALAKELGAKTKNATAANKQEKTALANAMEPAAEETAE